MNSGSIFESLSNEFPSYPRTYKDSVSISPVEITSKFIVEFILTDGNRRLSGSALTEEILLIVHSLPSVEE